MIVMEPRLATRVVWVWDRYVQEMKWGAGYGALSSKSEIESVDRLTLFMVATAVIFRTSGTDG